MATKQTFEQWLLTSCPVDDLLELEKGVYYMPIPVVRKKIRHMEKEFGISFKESNFNHFLFNDTYSKENIASGSLEVSFHIYNLVGAATFHFVRYLGNSHYAATLKSLCVVNALSSNFPQFGSLHFADVDLAKEVFSKGGVKAKPEMDIVVKSQYAKACKENDTKTINEIQSQYNVTIK